MCAFTFLTFCNEFYSAWFLFLCRMKGSDASWEDNNEPPEKVINCNKYQSTDQFDLVFLFVFLRQQWSNFLIQFHLFLTIYQLKIENFHSILLYYKNIFSTLIILMMKKKGEPKLNLVTVDPNRKRVTSFRVCAKFVVEDRKTGTLLQWWYNGFISSVSSKESL